MNSQAIQTQINDIQSSVAMNIATTDDYALAKLLSESITELRREVAATFDPIISKAHAAHKEALAQKKRYSVPLEENQKLIDGKVLAWEKQQSELAEMVEAITHETYETGVSKENRRVNWKFRIVDAAAIPREFLCPDLVKIGEEGRTYQELAKIPGVEFYTEETVIHRRAG